MKETLICSLEKHNIYYLSDANVSFYILVPYKEYDNTNISIRLKSNYDSYDLTKNSLEVVTNELINYYKNLDNYNITLILPVFYNNILDRIRVVEDLEMYQMVDRYLGVIFNNAYIFLTKNNVKVNNSIYVINNDSFKKFTNWFVSRYNNRIEYKTILDLVKDNGSYSNYNVIETPNMNFVVGKNTEPTIEKTVEMELETFDNLAKKTIEEEKKKEENKYIKFIKNLYNSRRGRAILFFVFYFVFFLVLISIIRTNYSSNNHINISNDNKVNTEYKLDGIESGNYHFTREENINGIITKFTGDKSDEKTEGIMTSNNIFYSYFIYDNINLIKTIDKYEVTSELYHFNNITDDNNISRILKKATLISKTEYETGNILYNYEITTNTINKIVNGKEIDIADIPNKIALETNEEDEVIKITYDLSSYATYINNISTTITIAIDYSNFNEIKDIEIPER